MSKCRNLNICVLNLSKSLINLSDIIKPHTTALIDLALRVWIAIIFWKSGVIKVGNWDVTLLLFEDEHPVPGLSPEIAAYLGTFNEIALPILLVIGLCGRIAAIGLLISTAIIQFTYIHSHEHFIWAMVLLAIIMRGSGLYSMDYFIRQKYMGTDIEVGKFSNYLAAMVVFILTIIVAHEAIAIMVDSVEPWLEQFLDCWGKIGAKK